MLTTYTNEIPFWDGTTYDNTVNPYTIAGDISTSITPTSFGNDNDVMKRLVESYLEEHCHGITVDEVLALIRNHQPERLL